VVVVRGQRSREKLVEVEGIDKTTVDRALGLCHPEGELLG